MGAAADESAGARCEDQGEEDLAALMSQRSLDLELLRRAGVNGDSSQNLASHLTLSETTKDEFRESGI